MVALVILWVVRKIRATDPNGGVLLELRVGIEMILNDFS
jgi:hypothetical protein